MPKSAKITNEEINQILNNYPISLPVSIASKLMDKSDMFIRCGLRSTPSRFDFGTAVLMDGGQWSYFISTAKFFDYIGIKVTISASLF